MTDNGESINASPIYRRVAWRLIPFLFLCYVINFVDRVNISFAKLQFLQSLHLSEAAYGMAAGMLFLGYTAFVIPGMKIVGAIGARRTMAMIMAIWGCCTIALAFANTQFAFYLIRFLIGASEAAFAPCVILYLTYWFPQRLRGQMMSLFEISPTIAGIIGGPLAGWILQGMSRSSMLMGWQWLFILEGIPAVVLGAIAWWWLADGPAHARWLTAIEARFIESDIRKSVGDAAHRDIGFLDVAKDSRVYAFSFVYFSIFWCLNIFGTWTPTLLQGAGVVAPLQIGIYSSLIAIASAIGAYLISRNSDRRLERFWHITAGASLTIFSFLMLRHAAGNIILMVALLGLGSIGIFTALSLFWTTPTTFFADDAARHAIAIMATLGSIGGFLSATLTGWLKVLTGDLNAGSELAAVILIVGMVTLRMALRPRTPGNATTGVSIGT